AWSRAAAASFGVFPSWTSRWTFGRRQRAPIHLLRAALEKAGEGARRRGERPAQKEPDGIDRDPREARRLAEEVQLLRVEHGEEPRSPEAADDEGRREDPAGKLHGCSFSIRHTPRGSSRISRQRPVASLGSAPS